MKSLADTPLWKKYLGLGLVFFLFFLVYYFPAQLTWPLLQKVGVDLVELYGLNGSWHSGTATSGRVLGIPVRDVSWRLRPTPLAPLRGGISATIAADGRLQGRLKAGWQGPQKGRAVISGLKADLPLSPFSGRLQRLGLAVDGRLLIDLARLELKNGIPVQGRGEGRLVGLRALQPIRLTLGDFQGELSSVAEGMRLGFRDDGGPLAANGVLALGSGGDYTLSAELVPRDPDNRELTMVLGFLGPPGRDGIIRVNAAGLLN